MPGKDAQEGKEIAFSIAQGALLRSVRAQRAMTLHDVEAATCGEFKAASLSAYERGERVISVLRLVRLASVYGTTLFELIPSLEAGDGDEQDGPGYVARPAGPHETEAATLPRRLRFDMERLAELDGPGWAQARRVVGAIRQRRRGRSGRFVSVRDEDLWLVAAVVGLSPTDLVSSLVREGAARAE